MASGSVEEDDDDDGDGDGEGDGSYKTISASYASASLPPAGSKSGSSRSNILVKKLGLYFV